VAYQDTQVLEDEEFARMLSLCNTQTAAGARNAALLLLMGRTGLRCNEALQVRAGDIRREEWQGHGKVWVLRVRTETTKGKKPRSPLPLDAETRAALDLWAEKRAALGLNGGPLFCTVSSGTRVHGAPSADGFSRGTAETALQPGGPLSSRYVRALVARLAEEAGIERRVHPHMLRHTALTNVQQRTGDLRVTQTVAGHTDPRNTVRYTEVKPEAVARALGVTPEEPQPAPQPAAEPDRLAVLEAQVAELRQMLAKALAQRPESGAET